MTSMIGFGGSTPNVSRIGGTGYNQVRVGVDPRIQQLWQQIAGGISPGLGGGMDFLSKLAQGGDEEMWNQIEAPALRQFGQLQGNTASRFSGQGLGGRSSSAFQNTMGGAASQLAEQLQANRMGLQQQAIRDLMGMGQTLLGTPLSQTGFLPQRKPAWQELLMGLSPGFGQGFGQFGAGGLGKWFGLF